MADSATPGRGTHASEISDGLVSLHKQYYGRGPTEAKTYLVNDTVVSLLRGGFTPIERTLIEQGNADAVHEMRRNFQTVMRHEFSNVVEHATGRKVVAYMSQIHSNPDIAVEIFVLEPGKPLMDQHEARIKEAAG
ncbi:MAG: hypothetical protein C5B48_10610 [Candidatus Rokuibacteriota bacterium]|nr:MAG: hypothetical protein C5B48_10610 [Candidatus Rokubacteria bacterium]